MFLCSTTCFAQDVIVKKDGSTILSKVIEIGSTEVKYKKFSNQDGPTYSVLKSEIQTINYENGEKESYNELPQQQKEFNYLNETRNSDNNVSVRNRFEADNLYREARALKTWSWVCVVLGAGGAVTSLFLNEENKTVSDICLYGGLAVCIVGGGTLMGLGQKKKREAESLLTSTIINYDIKVGKYTISPSVNLLSSTQTHKTNLGLGFKLQF